MLNDDIDYLHDCPLLELRYDLTNSSNRLLTLFLDCNGNIKHENREGRILRLTVSGVYYFQYVAWGHVIGYEILDRWSEGVTKQTEAELKKHQDMGFNVPSLRYTVTFHSGSFFELACEDITTATIKRS